MSSNCGSGIKPQHDVIPATVLYREIAARGYQGGMSQLRAFMRSLRPAPPADPVVRFTTADDLMLALSTVNRHEFC